MNEIFFFLLIGCKPNEWTKPSAGRVPAGQGQVQKSENPHGGVRVRVFWYWQRVGGVFCKTCPKSAPLPSLSSMHMRISLSFIHDTNRQMEERYKHIHDPLQRPHSYCCIFSKLPHSKLQIRKFIQWISHEIYLSILAKEGFYILKLDIIFQGWGSNCSVIWLLNGLLRFWKFSNSTNPLPLTKNKTLQALTKNKNNDKYIIRYTHNILGL